MPDVSAVSPRVRPARDAGFTLIEVVVAMALFLVMSTAVLMTVTTALRTTQDDASRQTAYNLAARELEITRDTFTSLTRGPDRVGTNRVIDPSPLPGGTMGQPLVVNGVPFTVERTAQWAPVDAQAATTCDEGTTSELAYLRVNVQVSWPALGKRPPVEMDTVMTPPKGTYTSAQGHLGIKVFDRDGKPVEAVPVTATSAAGVVRSGSTSDDGCVLLAYVDPGSWTVKASATGYVDPQGNAAPTLSATVQAGQLWRGSLSYDRAATLDVTFATATGYAVPTGVSSLPITVANSNLQPAGYRAMPGIGATRTLTNLWPYASGYQMWAGGCIDNDPKTSGGTRDLPVASDPGGRGPGTVTLDAFDVTGPANTTLVATEVVPSTDKACTSTPQKVTLGTTGPGGRLATSLPYGTWTVQPASGSTPAGQISLVPTDTAPGAVTLS